MWLIFNTNKKITFNMNSTFKSFNLGLKPPVSADQC